MVWTIHSLHPESQAMHYARGSFRRAKQSPRQRCMTSPATSIPSGRWPLPNLRSDEKTSVYDTFLWSDRTTCSMRTRFARLHATRLVFCIQLVTQRIYFVPHIDECASAKVRHTAHRRRRSSFFIQFVNRRAPHPRPMPLVPIVNTWGMSNPHQRNHCILALTPPCSLPVPTSFRL